MYIWTVANHLISLSLLGSQIGEVYSMARCMMVCRLSHAVTADRNGCFCPGRLIDGGLWLKWYWCGFPIQVFIDGKAQVFGVLNMFQHFASHQVIDADCPRVLHCWCYMGLNLPHQLLFVPHVVSTSDIPIFLCGLEIRRGRIRSSVAHGHFIKGLADVKYNSSQFSSSF